MALQRMLGVAGKDLAPLLRTLLAQLHFVAECHIQVGGGPRGAPRGLGGLGGSGWAVMGWSCGGQGEVESLGGL